jgi:hypothetical protein
MISSLFYVLNSSLKNDLLQCGDVGALFTVIMPEADILYICFISLIFWT